MTFNPADRLTAAAALSHAFLKQYACAEDEPASRQPFRIEDELEDSLVAERSHSAGSAGSTSRADSLPWDRWVLLTGFPRVFNRYVSSWLRTPLESLWLSGARGLSVCFYTHSPVFILFNSLLMQLCCYFLSVLVIEYSSVIAVC